MPPLPRKLILTGVKFTGKSHYVLYITINTNFRHFHFYPTANLAYYCTLFFTTDDIKFYKNLTPSMHCSDTLSLALLVLFVYISFLFLMNTYNITTRWSSIVWEVGTRPVLNHWKSWSIKVYVELKAKIMHTGISALLSLIIGDFLLIRSLQHWNWINLWHNQWNHKLFSCPQTLENFKKTLNSIRLDSNNS